MRADLVVFTAHNRMVLEPALCFYLKSSSISSRHYWNEVSSIAGELE